MKAVILDKQMINIGQVLKTETGAMICTGITTKFNRLSTCFELTIERYSFRAIDGQGGGDFIPSALQRAMKRGAYIIDYEKYEELIAKNKES